MNKYGIKNQKFLDRLFERFKLDKSSDKSERQEIDLQDFVIGLAVLSRLAFLDKIKCIFNRYIVIFYLTDLDQGINCIYYQMDVYLFKKQKI